MVRILILILAIYIISIDNFAYSQGEDLWKTKPMSGFCDPCFGSSLVSQNNWDLILSLTKVITSGSCTYSVSYKKKQCGNTWDIKIMSITPISGDCDTRQNLNPEADPCTKAKFYADQYNELMALFLIDMLADIPEGGTWRVIKPKCISYLNGIYNGPCSNSTECCSMTISAPKDECERWSFIPSESFETSPQVKCIADAGGGIPSDIPCSENLTFPEGPLPSELWCVPTCTEIKFYK